jgi:hypothetical protein
MAVMDFSKEAAILAIVDTFFNYAAAYFLLVA